MNIVFVLPEVLCNICLFAGETPGNFDIIIENDNLENAYKTLCNFILANLEPQPKKGESNVVFLTCYIYITRIT